MCDFDCSKYYDQCHAGCCGVIPFEKKMYEKHLTEIVTQPESLLESIETDPFDDLEKDFVIPWTKSGMCCFLQDDYKCAIYDDRPQVCKTYGDESISSLSCHYQDKNGRERTRQEKRLLQRLSEKNIKEYIKRTKANDV